MCCGLTFALNGTCWHGMLEATRPCIMHAGRLIQSVPWDPHLSKGDLSLLPQFALAGVRCDLERCWLPSMREKQASAMGRSVDQLGLLTLWGRHSARYVQNYSHFLR